MTFSVIVPIYNVEDYLEECLLSLQRQDFEDFEVVCIDDGSTDRSPAILAQWERRWPKMRVINRENGGLSAARNTGLRNATGDYVVFIDSDDWVEPAMLGALARNIGNADMICFACRRTDNWAVDSIAPEQASGWDYYNRHALESRVVPFVCVWQRCYRRQMLLDNDLWFREGIVHEDNEFTPRVCHKTKEVKVIADVLYHYRVRPDSIMTHRGLQSKKDLICIANSLSTMFNKVADIDKTTVYRSLTQYYQMAFAANTPADDRQLLPLVDWQCYRRVSRTKARHWLQYSALHISPRLFRWVLSRFKK